MRRAWKGVQVRLQKYDTEDHAGGFSISPLLADELLVSDHVQSGEVSRRGKVMSF